MYKYHPFCSLVIPRVCKNTAQRKSLHHTNKHSQTKYNFMECSTYPWFSEPGMMNQSSEIMDSVNNSQIFTDDFMGTIDELLGEDFLNTYDPSSLCTDNIPLSNQSSPEPPLIIDSGTPPPKRKRGVDRAPNTAPIILNFGEAIATKNVDNVNSSWLLDNDQVEMVNQEEVKNGTQAANKSNRDRPQAQAYDHIISERKRRKLLSEQFLTLSGMVPGLKKMDKTSVLGATIKYMRNLQERADMLEEKLAKETVESAVLVRKSQIMVEQEDEGSSDENSGCSSNNQPLPEIEAKVCNNQALLKIHCEKQKGVMVKILNQIEKLNLTVLNSNVSPFGNLILDITIIVEMDKEYALMANQIVQALHSVLMTAAT